MKLKDLILLFRHEAKDEKNPYLWSDTAVIAWLNEAQEQACVRGRLLLEDSDVEVCRIELAAGTQSYRLHPSLYEISCIRLLKAAGGQGRELSIKSREWLQAEVNDWRSYADEARWVIQDETKLRVVGAFDTGDELRLEGYRLPLVRMANPDNDEPEIHQASHSQLVNWALHRAFGQPDADRFDPQRAAKAEAEFTAYFGPLPDSGLRRETRKDTQHTTMLILP